MFDTLHQSFLNGIHPKLKTGKQYYFFPKRWKTQQSSGFRTLEPHGIVFIEYFKKDQKITAHHHMAQLVGLKTQCHRWMKLMAKICEVHFEVLSSSLYQIKRWSSKKGPIMWGQDKSFYREVLKYWKDCIGIEGNYADK